MFFLVVFYEPADVQKSVKPFEAGIQHAVTYMKPNLSELSEIYLLVTGGMRAHWIRSSSKSI